MTEYFIKKWFPKVYESIRLKGYDKGYTEGYAIGYGNGKMQGYFDGLLVGKVKGMHINNYGFTIIEDGTLKKALSLEDEI